MRKKAIHSLVNRENTPTANLMLISMLGSNDLVDKWWRSPNKAFDNKCPVEVDDQDVIKYLMFHTFGYGGS
jgi:hypothetical protein